MKSQIKQIGDSILVKKCAPILELGHPEDMSPIKKALRTLQLMRNAAAIAAPQVGVSKRWFVYRDGSVNRAIINPTLVESSGELVYPESCLSIPNTELMITRPAEILVTGADLHGEQVSLHLDGHIGRVFQHELDHLDGVLMIERVDEDQKARLLNRFHRYSREVS